jgi:hypothetical protein
MSVKTIQHRKAMGNTRKQNRATYGYIFRTVNWGVKEVTTTAYGEEKIPSITQISVDPSTGENILAVGRLERLDSGATEGDIRLVNKEAYTLYWLPFYASENTDYENPRNIGTEINPSNPVGFDFIQPGMRIWMTTDSFGLQDPDGATADEFVVVSSNRLGGADVAEYEATVVRSEGAPRIQVTLI